MAHTQCHVLVNASLSTISATWHIHMYSLMLYDNMAHTHVFIIIYDICNMAHTHALVNASLSTISVPLESEPQLHYVVVKLTLKAVFP